MSRVCSCVCFAGELPLDRNARKVRKPDFEALVRLEPFAGCRFGRIARARIRIAQEPTARGAVAAHRIVR
jgi:hypothetical protein